VTGLTVLFTFALGTAAGDLTAERLAVGYWKSALLFGALIGAVYLLHLKLGLNAILSFWIASILTRPLGASIGDFLSQPRADGGLGLGTTGPSAIFLLTILAVVVYLTLTKVDLIANDVVPSRARKPGAVALVLVVTNKVAATPALIDAVRERAAGGPAEFFTLVPNPGHPAFDRVGGDLHAAWSRAASHPVPTRTTTSSPSSTRVPTTRSSSRRRRATCRTGSTSTSLSASHISGTRRSPSRRRTRGVSA
jgi:hypothetical protein